MLMNEYVGAWDPGYGGSKMALVGQDGMTKVVVPSVTGMGKTDIGHLSLGEVGRQRRRRLPDRVAFDGVTYLVGDGVERYAEPMDGMDFLRLRGGPGMRALLYDTIYRALGAGEHWLSLFIGLPVEVMMDEGAANATQRALREWLLKAHRFGVNGEEMAVTVKSLAVLAQPVGSFFAWGLDDAGRWTRSSSDLHAPVGILDIGFNTLDLFAVEGAEIARRYTDGDALGMRRAAEHLIRSVDDAYGMALSLHQADALIREADPVLHTSQGRVSLTGLVEQALSHAASRILSFVQRSDRWGSGRQFAYQLITGGGAEALRAELEETFPRAYVLPEPMTANAVGLARYARRAFG